MLEAVSIKSLSPSMCLQKEDVKKLMLLCVSCIIVYFITMYMYITQFYVLNVILHLISYFEVARYWF